MRKHLINLGLGLGIVALVAVAFVIGRGAVAPGEEAFVGADSQAVVVARESHPGYQPWFEPFFEPASGEIESGLFALQAGIGGIVVGYCIAGLRARRRIEALRAELATASGTAAETGQA